MWLLQSGAPGSARDPAPSARGFAVPATLPEAGPARSGTPASSRRALAPDGDKAGAPREPDILVARIRVLAAGGLPLGGAAVRASLPERGAESWQGSTDADGSWDFRLDSADAGSLDLLVLEALVEADGCASARRTHRFLSPPPVDLEFHLIPGGSLEVQVTDAAGAPVPHAPVGIYRGDIFGPVATLLEMTTDTWTPRTGFTGEDGIIRFSGLEEGAWQLAVPASRCWDEPAEAEARVLADRSARQVLRLRTWDSDLYASGQVRRSDATPFDELCVRAAGAAGPRFPVHEDGAFFIPPEELAGAELLLEVADAGGARSAACRVRPGQHRLSIALAPHPDRHAPR